MKKIRASRRWIGISALVLGAVFELTGVGSAQEWKQAIGPWNWSFPRDHGSHAPFRTEWWYFTGNLRNPEGNRLGYQLTFFRQGIRFKRKDQGGPWSIRDLYFGHFALTDALAGQFWYAERLSREGPGLAGAGEKAMDVWLLNWKAKQAGAKVNLEARHEAMALSLEVESQKPIIFHGKNGLSQKGPREGQASYYYSYTDMKVRGSVKTPLSPSAIPVEGKGWFDHEFGSNQLSPEQVGWDWFSLHLSDGQDLMIYLLRRKDGTFEPSSSGTLVSPKGRSLHLRLSDFQIEILDRWKSPKSGATYPSHWRVKVPLAQITVELKPLIPSQELLTGGSTGVTYWEGAVAGRGTSGGKTITCEGYVELTGYASFLRGLF